MKFYFLCASLIVLLGSSSANAALHFKSEQLPGLTLKVGFAFEEGEQSEPVWAGFYRDGKKIYEDQCAVFAKVNKRGVQSTVLGCSEEIVPKKGGEYLEEYKEELTLELRARPKWGSKAFDLVVHYFEPGLESVKPQLKSAAEALVGREFSGPIQGETYRFKKTRSEPLPKNPIDLVNYVSGALQPLLGCEFVSVGEKTRTVDSLSVSVRRMGDSYGFFGSLEYWPEKGETTRIGNRTVSYTHLTLPTSG